MARFRDNPAWADDHLMDDRMAEARAEAQATPSSPAARGLTPKQTDAALSRAVAARGGKALTEKQQEAALKRASIDIAHGNERRRNVGRRKRWEADVAVPAEETAPLQHPTMDQLRQVRDTIPSRLVQPAPRTGSAAAEGYIPRGRMLTAPEIYRTSMPVGQIYDVMGWNSGEHNHPGMGQEVLPGLEHPDSVGTPGSWTDKTAEEQSATEERIRRGTGADLDSMTRSFGAQLDQAHIRAELYGSHPHTKDFYTDGPPKQVIRQSARELGVPFGVHAAMNAFTSPQTKFEQGGRYPNNESAVAAVEMARSGVDPSTITSMPADANGIARQGYPANFRKAVRHFQEWESEGKALRDMTTEKGQPAFGPKTGPYHNSWLDSHPDYFVADVHSGGGGMIPHLSAEKPYKRNPDGTPILTDSGQPAKEKSEREKAIEKAGFHSMADEAARRAMRERGLDVVRVAQAAQWGEEKIQRGYDKPDVVFAHPATAPSPSGVPEQLSLFPASEEITAPPNDRAIRRSRNTKA